MTVRNGIGTSSRVVEIGGQPVPYVASITLAFDDERVSGQSACNAYFAGVTTTGAGELAFSGMGATRRACPDPQMELERRYLTTLAGATRYSFLVGRLALSCTTDDGLTVLLFKPQQAQSGRGDRER